MDPIIGAHVHYKNIVDIILTQPSNETLPVSPHGSREVTTRIVKLLQPNIQNVIDVIDKLMIDPEFHGFLEFMLTCPIKSYNFTAIIKKPIGNVIPEPFMMLNILVDNTTPEFKIFPNGNKFVEEIYPYAKLTHSLPVTNELSDDLGLMVHTHTILMDMRYHLTYNPITQLDAFVADNMSITNDLRVAQMVSIVPGDNLDVSGYRSDGKPNNEEMTPDEPVYPSVLSNFMHELYYELDVFGLAQMQALFTFRHITGCDAGTFNFERVRAYDRYVGASRMAFIYKLVGYAGFPIRQLSIFDFDIATELLCGENTESGTDVLPFSIFKFIASIYSDQYNLILPVRYMVRKEYALPYTIDNTSNLVNMSSGKLDSALFRFTKNNIPVEFAVKNHSFDVYLEYFSDIYNCEWFAEIRMSVIYKLSKPFTTVTDAGLANLQYMMKIPADIIDALEFDGRNKYMIDVMSQFEEMLQCKNCTNRYILANTSGYIICAICIDPPETSVVKEDPSADPTHTSSIKLTQSVSGNTKKKGWLSLLGL